MGARLMCVDVGGLVAGDGCVCKGVLEKSAAAALVQERLLASPSNNFWEYAARKTGGKGKT